MKFEYFIFSNETSLAEKALAAGMNTFIIDWEQMNKPARQSGFDTEIRPGTAADLQAISHLQGARTWCRINHYGPHSRVEIDAAIEHSAHGIFLPMVRSPSEVEQFLRHVDGRCHTGILLETTEGFHVASELNQLPVERVYFGLNDFAISRGGGSIFRALLDGSIEQMREAFADKLFGFGGITTIGSGYPIPTTCLIQEMVRLNCHYSFLRRSFRHDMAGRDLRQVACEIDDYIDTCRRRDITTIQRDRAKLEEVINARCL